LRHILKPPALRQTAGVLLDIIDNATSSISIATPFADTDAVRFLAPALLDAARRGVQIRVLTSRGAGDVFRSLGEQWKGYARASFEVAEIATDLSTLGSHAKVVSADGERAYVGSANVTAPGFGKHVEIGVEVAGPQVMALERILRALRR